MKTPREPFARSNSHHSKSKSQDHYLLNHHNEKQRGIDVSDRFNEVLGETVEAMEEAGIKYLFIGGIASSGLGRPRLTEDIDLFVIPEEAELALHALGAKGFQTEKTDPTWLYKGIKNGILVDIIFKSKGEIYLDQEMYQRMTTAEFHKKRLRLVAPEDLLIIKAAAHSEITPSHWHDAIALLSHASLDWAYLIRRARKAPRRILSLLLYAQSNDIWVPNHVIHELYSGIFGYNEKKLFDKPPFVEERRGGELEQRKHVASEGSVQEDVRHSELSSPTVRPLHEEKSRQMRGQEKTRGIPRIEGASWPKSGNDQKAAAQGQDKHDLAESPAARPVGSVFYLAAHLRQILAEDSRTNELNIRVQQHGSRIVLEGEVSEEGRKNMIEKIAREICGDRVLENRIQVVFLDSAAGSEQVR